MKVIIIYNPNSTGDSETNAKNLAKELRTLGVDVSTRATKHAGHGEQIAAQLVRKDEETVLISSSGDGGYHEVVNGFLSEPSKNVVVGVLPSGNANDHYAAIGSGSLAASIRDKKFQTIDTIKVSGMIDGQPWQRYAHSYVGIGVTAEAAKQLTVERPNVVTEKWIVLHSLFSFRYVKLIENGKKNRYSSLIFSNIHRMSKVMKLSDRASISDGRFEMSGIRFHSKVRLIGYLVTAATIGLKFTPSVKRFECQTVEALPIQLDGESYTLDAGSKLTVESVKRSLRCVL